MLVNIHDAKTNLSKLLNMLDDQKEIIIARAGNPIAKLVSYSKPKPQRKAGMLKGQIQISDDFTETSQEIIDSFYNSDLP